MAIKGNIRSDHIQVNKYVLTIAGIKPIVFTSIGGISEELDNVELPDRTVRSGGRTKPSSFEIVQPMHHIDEVKLMSIWWKHCKETIAGYKRQGVLVLISQSGSLISSYQLDGMVLTGRALPDLEQDNEGEMATVTYTISCDEVIELT